MGYMVIIIDDNRRYTDAVSRDLRAAGHFPSVCSTGKEGIHHIATTSVDVILCHMQLPDMKASDVCRQLGYAGEAPLVPLIVLADEYCEMDAVVSFSLGATDYVVKTTGNRELVLRIDAIMKRRRRLRKKKMVSTGPVSIDVSRQCAFVEGTGIHLTVTEYKLLLCLVRADGRVVSREEILSTVWDRDTHVLQRTVDAHIRAIRKKLDRWRDCLETVQGVGYRITVSSSSKSKTDTPMSGQFTRLCANCVEHDASPSPDRNNRAL